MNMRTFAHLAAALGLAAVAQAQITLNLGQPMGSPNQGSINGGIYFNMTVTNTFTWDELDYTAAAGTAGNMSSFNIYFGPASWQGNVGSNPGPWVLIGSSTPVMLTGVNDQTITGVINPAGANTGTVTFAPGTYGIALEAVNHSWGYQNGVFTFSDPNVSITTGGASNAFLSLPTFSPRTINGVMRYTLGGTPISLASFQSYGEGCYANYRSFYELMANTATDQDLGNTSLLLSLDQTNGLYTVTAGTTPVQAAGPGAVNQTFADDDASVQIALNSIPITYVGSNGITTSPFDPVVNDLVCEMSADGFISLDGTNAGGNPVQADFFTGGARVGNWHDMDPVTGGGTVWYEFDPTAVVGGVANGAHLFTWEAVPSRGSAGTNTFQIACSLNGDIELRWGTMNTAVGGGWPTLVGYTPGNGALDPGEIDISTAAAGAGFATQASDSDPLRLDIDAAPVLGTTVTLTTSNETSNPGVGLTIFSSTPLNNPPVLAPIDLVIIGAPGCWANVGTIDVAFVIDNIPVNGMSSAFPIPNQPAAIGLKLGAQSVWLDSSQNAFGLISSNGILMTLGV